MKHVVIGGGPSGVIYALKVKKDYPNDKVVIIESSDKLLKRVLVSGNGRANFFNQELLDNSIDKAYDNKDAALKIIEKDYASKTLAFLRELGLIYIIDNAGRFYPYSNSSLTVWKVLIEAIKKFNIDFILNEKVVSVDESKKTVLLASLKKVKYDKLFVAVGGYSYDRIKGINKSLLDSLMVKYNLFEPVLCPLKTKEKIPEYLVGARAFATVKLLENDKEIYCENGEILFKKDGISGISIFDSSLYIDSNSNKKYKVLVDLTKRDNFCIDKNDKSIPLDLMINERIAKYLIDRYKNSAYEHLDSIEFNISGKYELKESQVSKGGILLDEIDLHNMSLKKYSDIYVGGEIIDLSAICGGYNMGLAFITGYKAASKK